MDLLTALRTSGPLADDRVLTAEELRRERAALDEAYRNSADYVAPVVGAPARERLLAPVPPRFAAADFADFEPESPSQRAALVAARAFVTRARRGDPAMLALIGSQGAGKSHLLYAAARHLADGGVRVWHRPWYKLADELRYGGADPFTGATLEAAQVREALYRERVVLIDEVRPTAGTAFDDTELAKWACHAYDQNLAVLITTNVNPLADVMGPPAASRFTQVVVDGRDRRQAR